MLILITSKQTNSFLDIVEKNYDPTGQGSSSEFYVDVNHTYTDLDELIVHHVKAMVKLVEQLMAHERFKPGSEDELRKSVCEWSPVFYTESLYTDLFLKNQLLANPAKSMYGFTLNRKRPGHFNLCFLANKDSTVQTWVCRLLSLYTIQC